MITENNYQNRWNFYVDWQKRFIIPDSARHAKETRDRFYKFARGRIIFLDSQEYDFFETRFLGCALQAFASFAIAHTTLENTKDREVTGLLIAINKDAFKIDQEDYSDLIPFSTEHELYELWLTLTEGQRLDRKNMHLLARRKQYEIAMRGGKAERLLEFQRRNPFIEEECNYAYKRALQKASRRKSRREENEH
jgi:transcriptional antiterminator Rof (Rho-off)